MYGKGCKRILALAGAAVVMTAAFLQGCGGKADSTGNQDAKVTEAQEQRVVHRGSGRGFLAGSRKQRRSGSRAGDAVPQGRNHAAG